MTNTTTLPQTQNAGWGFFGTISHHAEPQAAWNLAIAAISDATGLPLDTARAFLDSRQGRHFADSLANRLTDEATDNANAIAATVAEWMAWRITRRTSRDTGIPIGLPYLTGFALAAEIAEEAAA
jgi:hypothetical protein